MIRTRTLTIGVIGALLLVLLAYGFWPTARSVTVATVERDSMRVTVEEEGRTRLRERYVVSAPTTGYLKRVPGEAGDSVRAGEVLARLATLPSTILDAGSHEATEANVQAARAALRRAQEKAEKARAARSYAKEEHRRTKRLHEQGTASQQQLDRARVAFRKARAQHEAAQQSVAQAESELRAVRSRLSRDPAASRSLPPRASIRSPVDGQILKVHQKSAGVVQGGTPLLTVGNPDSLEVSVDVLSSDAVRITEGTPVKLVRWGGGDTLSGRVRVVAPRGRTEVSALGVEEQRVNVRVDIVDDPTQRARLGTGYRVVAHFVTWAGTGVLQVPQSALFRYDEGWAVFVVRDGRAQRRSVEIGHRAGLRAEVTKGLQAGDRVVTHPGNALSDGMRVEAR
ncbi:MAG: efflux RND transporter periplasmic adaptor subunit [Salinibacter sp.]